MTEPQDHAIDAIIFIPGLKSQPFDNAALRIASAFNLEARTPEAQFDLEAGQDEDYISHEGQSLKTRLRTIRRTDPGGQAHKIVDIYEFSYIDSLTKSYSDKNVLIQALRLFLSIVINIPRVITALFDPKKRQKTALEKLQYILAIAILSLLVGYLILLGFAIADTIRQVPQIQALTTSPSNTPPSNTANQTNTQQPVKMPLTLSQIFIIAIAAIEVFYPNLKQVFIDAAVTWISVIDYIGVGARSQAVSGQLLALIDHVATQKYRRIHIVAYSFGSIIALDNLFPAGHAPAARIQKINTLVTIGCPFDLIRVFWPDYFKERVMLENVPTQWINVYSPIDVMASNFRDNPAIGAPEPEHAISARDNSSIKLIPQTNIVWNAGRPKRALSFLEFLTLAGLEAHRSYWETEFESENTAFSPITSALYQDDPILA